MPITSPKPPIGLATLPVVRPVRIGESLVTALLA